MPTKVFFECACYSGYQTSWSAGWVKFEHHGNKSVSVGFFFIVVFLLLFFGLKKSWERESVQRCNWCRKRKDTLKSGQFQPNREVSFDIHQIMAISRSFAPSNSTTHPCSDCCNFARSPFSEFSLKKVLFFFASYTGPAQQHVFSSTYSMDWPVIWTPRAQTCSLFTIDVPFSLCLHNSKTAMRHSARCEWLGITLMVHTHGGYYLMLILWVCHSISVLLMLIPHCLRSFSSLAREGKLY